MTVETFEDEVKVLGPIAAETNIQLDFPFLDPLEIKAVISNGTSEIPLVNGVDYEVTGGQPESGNFELLTAVAGGFELLAYREPIAKQDIDFVENDDFPAENNEKGHDRSMMLILWILKQLKLVPTLPVTTGLGDPGGDPVDLTLPTPEANLFLRWNAAADALENAAGPDLPETFVRRQYHTVSGSPQQDFDMSNPTSGTAFTATDPQSIMVFSLESGAVERRQLRANGAGDWTLPGGNIMRLSAPISPGGDVVIFSFNPLLSGADPVEAQGDGVEVDFDISPLSIENQFDLMVYSDGVFQKYSAWSLLDANTVRFNTAPGNVELAFVPRLGKKGDQGEQGPPGFGDVTGPGSSTPDGIPRYSDATGKVIDNSPATLDGAGNFSTPGTISSTGAVNGRDMGSDGSKLDGIESGAQQNNISNPNAVDLTDGGDTNLHHHDSFYHRKTEFKDSSAGVGDAGAPVKLDVNGKIDDSMLNITALNFKGNWDANANSPALSDSGGGGVQNDYYIVSVAGTTSLDGISDWQIGDWVVNTGSVWIKVDNTDAVQSVAGKTGVVTLDHDDITDFDAGVAAAPAVAANTAKVSADGSVTTHSDVTDAGSGAIITSSERTKLNGLMSVANSDELTGSGNTTLHRHANATPSLDGYMSQTDKSKLDGVESGATADQTDGEIETAYNNQVAAASQAEAEAGTEAAIRRFSPLRIAQAIAALGVSVKNYVFAYDTTTQNVAVADTFQALTYNTNGQLNGWTHTPGSNVFGCTQTGLYKVTMTAQIEKAGGADSEGGMRALFNGAEVLGSFVSRDVTSNGLNLEITTTFMVQATTGQNLTTEFYGGTTNVSLAPPPNGAGGTAASAKITIERVA